MNDLKVVDARCKYCGIPLRLMVDAGYDHDPMKLLPLACCNNCGDTRIDWRQVNWRIARLVSLLIANPGNEKIKESAIKGFKVWVPEYLRLTGQFTRRTPTPWNDEIAHILADDPKKAGDTLKSLWPLKPKATQQMIEV